MKMLLLLLLLLSWGCGNRQCCACPKINILDIQYVDKEVFLRAQFANCPLGKKGKDIRFQLINKYLNDCFGMGSFSINEYLDKKANVYRYTVESELFKKGLSND